jgi:hypothetical protein
MFDLWFAFVCIACLLLWVGAELFAAVPSWARRLQRLQRGRQAQAAEYAAKSSKGAMLPTHSTGG